MPGENVETALVHDWLVTTGGAERVLGSMLEVFPEATLHVLVYRRSPAVDEVLQGRNVVTSFLQHLPGSGRWYRMYLLLMPLAVEGFDLSGYNLVISSSHAVAKGARTQTGQLHISYVHTPMRYAWDLEAEYLEVSRRTGWLLRLVARPILHYLRLWDVVSANRVDVFVANSRHVAARIWRIYRRRAKVIYPPVDVERFEPKLPREEFYLTVARLVPYKRLDVVVEAFRRLGRPLVVIGDGPELGKLRRAAPRNVRFLGWQPERVIKDYMERARAFVFAAEEDFGIAPVEAQAAGAPVIAYGRGGVAESVVPGETGILFHEQSAEALAEAVLSFESSAERFSVERIRSNAERFGKERFKREFAELVEREWRAFQKRWRHCGGGLNE